MTKKHEDKKVNPDNKIVNVFELINLAGKRARELVSGAPKLIQEEIEDPIQIALREISEGKITVGRKQNIHEEKQGKKEK
ncbi:MAG: DNA-directed RNA polymerase subunit omega [Candidatus Ratteibacteria bacterium]|nr:DNA-directed RNA polymerase subunit omega [Candidatus Ratteibacteria bacterium]